jgi:hypothetical protein
MSSSDVDMQVSIEMTPPVEAVPPPNSPFQEAVLDLERNRKLDTLVSALAGPANLVAKGPARRVLGGEWLGHPLHPALTDIPLGCWTASWFLDVLGGRSSRRASQRLIALGLLASLPTAASGLSDWSTIKEQPTRRVGAVHAALNSGALVVYFLSWRPRRRGRHGRGVMLGMMGGGVASVSGYLGGDLAFRSASEPASPS